MWPFSRRKQDAFKPDVAIIGLGNPGPIYSGSRHNAGFMCLNHFASSHQILWAGRRGPLIWGEGQITGNHLSMNILLAKPRTYMNQSGEAVRYIVKRWHLNPQELMIVYDEMDLPLGKIRIRLGGSPGGHNGIRSIINALGTEEIPRIRVGIGRRGGDATDAIDHVLGDFTDEEMQVFEEVLPVVSDAILCVALEGIDAAMNRFN